jgi:hypothetical protein
MVDQADDFCNGVESDRPFPSLPIHLRQSP